MPFAPNMHWPLLLLIAGFAVLTIAEIAGGRATAGGDRRLIANFGLGALNIVLGAALPIGTVSAALLAPRIGSGALASFAWLAAILILLPIRSLGDYWLHRLSHRTPWLWRIHRVHHADSAIDVSTALRNHPLELLLSVLVAATIVLALGPPVAAVIATDGILLIGSLWQHVDLALSRRFARRVEWLIVTPDYHRIHHSIDRAEHDRNYGDVLTIWDRLFGTLRNPGETPVTVGLSGEERHADSLVAQLTRPFGLPRT